MSDTFEMIGRKLAYRWFLSSNPDLTPEEAWEHAREHWQELSCPKLEAARTLPDLHPPFAEASEDWDECWQADFDVDGTSALLAEK